MLKAPVRRGLGILLSTAVAASLLAGIPQGTATAAETTAEISRVVFQIGSSTYTVDGTEYKMDVSPRIDERSGRTLLPVRYAAEAMNAQVYYNGEGQRITIVHNQTQRVVELGIGDSQMRVADSEEKYDDVKLDQEPTVDPPGRTMLPIRAIAEALYGQVSYDPATRRITIERPPTRPVGPGPVMVDFGQMLAPELDHERMERHPMNERTVIITNTTRTDATITSLAFKDGRQFTLCGRQYEPFTLKPGEARAIPVCTIAQESGRHIDSLIFKTRGELRIFDISLIVYILGCRVSIDGGGQRPNGNTSGTAPLAAAGIDRPLVNVGEEIALSANVTGNFAPFTYQWTVTGGHIKDYNESWTTAYSTTPMAAADYKQPTIDFYWMQVGAYTVTVKATNSLGFTCTATTNWSVERNATDVNRVAEAFYSFNHSSKVLVQHSAWHGAHPLMGCSGAGYAFKTFHRAYMDRFNSWRATFGYPALAGWNPATPLPGGVSNAHVSRAAVYNPAAGVLPSYLTVAGGALSSPCFGVTSKPAFPSANALWVDIERFHNGVHGAIGGVSGDMSYIGRAPKDPIFWRYHSWVDTLG